MLRCNGRIREAGSDHRALKAAGAGTHRDRAVRNLVELPTMELDRWMDDRKRTNKAAISSSTFAWPSRSFLLPS